MTSALLNRSISGLPTSRNSRRLSFGNSPTRSIQSISSPRSRHISFRVLRPLLRIFRGSDKTSSANSGSKVCNSWKSTMSTGESACFDNNNAISDSFASVRNVRHRAEESCAAIVMCYRRRASEVFRRSL